MKPVYDANFFPLGELPFDTYCYVINDKRICEKFIPSKMEEDLAIGGLNRLIYWYPRYRDILYEMADNGEDYKKWLKDLHSVNAMLFVEFFPSTVKQLDKLIEKRIKIKSNHLSEMIVKPSN